VTGADGIMSAEGLLDNPALFWPALGLVEHSSRLSIIDLLFFFSSLEYLSSLSSLCSFLLSLSSASCCLLPTLLLDVPLISPIDVYKRGGILVAVAMQRVSATYSQQMNTCQDGNPPDDLTLASEYLDLCETHPGVSVDSMRGIILRICRKTIPKYTHIET
jgi:hypothetical protein